MHAARVTGADHTSPVSGQHVCSSLSASFCRPALFQRSGHSLAQGPSLQQGAGGVSAGGLRGTSGCLGSAAAHNHDSRRHRPDGSGDLPELVTIGRSRKTAGDLEENLAFMGRW